jgi:hypothetical protein
VNIPKCSSSDAQYPGWLEWCLYLYCQIFMQQPCYWLGKYKDTRWYHIQSSEVFIISKIHNKSLGDTYFPTVFACMFSNRNSYPILLKRDNFILSWWQCDIKAYSCRGIRRNQCNFCCSQCLNSLFTPISPLFGTCAENRSISFTFLSVKCLFFLCVFADK